MHISINTAEEITELDRQVLGILAGGSFVLGEVGEAPEPEPKPEPAKPAKKAAAKKKSEPKPEPEPEPMAEEPAEEPEEPEEEDSEFEEQSDEDLLKLAIERATEMVTGGDAAKVRTALDAAGASRVRELNADNVREFFKALS